MNLQTAEGLPNPAPLFAKLSRETEKNKDERRQQRDEGHTAGDPSPKNRPGKGTGNGEDLSRKKERLDREDEETRVLLASTTGISNPGSFVAGKIQILDRASLEKMSDEAIIQRILDLQTLLTGGRNALYTHHTDPAESRPCVHAYTLYVHTSPAFPSFLSTYAYGRFSICRGGIQTRVCTAAECIHTGTHIQVEKPN